MCRVNRTKVIETLKWNFHWIPYFQHFKYHKQSQKEFINLKKRSISRNALNRTPTGLFTWNGDMSATRRLSIISLDSKRNSDPVLLPVYLYQYSKKSCVYTPCQESTDIVFFPCSTSYLQVYHRLEHNMEICDNKQRQVNGSSTISYFNTTITMVHLSRKLFHMLLYVWRDITLACW